MCYHTQINFLFQLVFIDYNGFIMEPINKTFTPQEFFTWLNQLLMENKRHNSTNMAQ